VRALRRQRQERIVNLTTFFWTEGKMGILWEVVQTGLMYGQKRKSDSIEDRVQFLEEQLTQTQKTLWDLVKKLEEMLRTDINGDGKVGWAKGRLAGLPPPSRQAGQWTGSSNFWIREGLSMVSCSWCWSVGNQPIRRRSMCRNIGSKCARLAGRHEWGRFACGSGRLVILSGARAK
jgi:hypothetical protein